MSRRPLPFISSLFQQPASRAPSPTNITSFTETIVEAEPGLSPESEYILRRGNWDYMTVRVKDKAAQDHPEFTPDASYGEDDQTYR